VKGSIILVYLLGIIDFLAQSKSIGEADTKEILKTILQEDYEYTPEQTVTVFN